MRELSHRLDPDATAFGFARQLPALGLLIALAACASYAFGCDGGGMPSRTADALPDATSAIVAPDAAPAQDAAAGAQLDAAGARTDAATAPSSVGDADAGKTVAPAVDGNDANAVRDAALPPTDAQSAVTCPAGPGLAAGDHKLSLQHEGRSRTYLLHVPKSYDGTKPRPLVLDFHGYSRTSAGQKAASGWDAVSDREGLLVAYPDGVGSSWNVGGCCGSAGTSNIDDVGFARALVAQLATQLCVDLKRVYASGVSNGAGISARLGCEAADLFAGVALVSSDLRTQPCQPRRPITEIAFRGTGDTLEPYEGGLVGPVGMQFQSPGARGSFELWKNINRCTGAPIASVKLCETYTECAEGVEVTLCTMPGVGHSPYDNNLSFDIAQTTWDAYQRAPAH